MNSVQSYNKAKKLEAEEKYLEANKILIQLSKSEPENEIYIAMIAMNYLSANEIDLFKKYALIFLEDIPNEKKRTSDLTSWCLYHSLGVLMHQQGNEEQAIKYYQKAIEIKNNAETIAFLGKAYMDLGHEKQAISYLKTSAKMGHGGAIMMLNSRGIDL